MSQRRRKRNRVTGAFALRPIAMIESFPYRVLSQAAHRVLARIEIEHAHHGGTDNGRLPVTFADFEKYGIHLASIAAAIRELEALGFIEVTERGCAGNAEFRKPSLYRLTYRHAHGADGDGTHEYRSITTLSDAKQIAETARAAADPKRVARGKKSNTAAVLRRISPPEIGSEAPEIVNGIR